MKSDIYEALTVLLTLGECTQTVFWTDKFPGGEDMFRRWARDHSHLVDVDERDVSIMIHRKDNCTEVATFRKDHLKAKTSDDSMWSPAHQAAVKSNNKKEKSVSKSKATERAVIVTTEHRGVFFGYATATDGETIDLKRARLCVYWSSDVKGFMGLAAGGPTKGCKIGPAVPSIELRKITSVVGVSPEAAEAWEKAPWS